MRERPLAVDVSVVAPVFGNRGTLAALRERVGHVLDARGARWELVLVNDNCPGGSGEVMDALAAEDPRVRCIHLTERSGQQRALVAGIRASVGHAVVTLDADLQDPPEAIPLLLDRLGEASVVYAGRRGEYQAKHRRVTSAIFKTLLSIVAKTPRDGGAFIAFDRAAADSIARFRTGHPFVPAMASLLGLPVESVPVERDVRADGTSAYTSLRRMRVGVAALLDALVWRVEGRGPAAAREAHNRAQVDYYGRTEHPSMLPHSTSGYVDAQIAKALAAADVDDAARVLEIGAGMGRYTVRLAEMLGDRLEALELSPGMLADLAVAAPSMQAGHLHCADASDPPEVLLGRFDVVLGFFMLHHVHDLAAVLEGASRCLKPGGRVVFVEPNPLNVLYYVQMAVVPGMTFAGDRGIVRMRPRILAEAANEAGLMGFGYERFGFWPPFVRNTAFGAASERALERVPFLRPVLPFQLFFAEKPGPRSVAGSSTEDR